MTFIGHTKIDNMVQKCNLLFEEHMKRLRESEERAFKHAKRSCVDVSDDFLIPKLEANPLYFEKQNLETIISEF